MAGRIIQFVVARIALLVAIEIAAMAFIGLIWSWTRAGAFATDFGVYWRTANTPVDWAYWQGYLYPFPYAPTMLLWIAPLKLAPLWPAFALWLILSAAAMIWAVRPYLSRHETLLLMFSPPLVSGLATGQVSTVLAALMLWASGTPSRYRAGIAFGIIASIKPQLVVMAPLMFLLTKDWKAVIGSAATFAAIILAALFVFGSAIWVEWADSMSYFRFALNDLNIIGSSASLASQAEWWGLPPAPFLILGIALGIGLVVACRNGPPLEKCAAIGAGSILAAPYSLTYDLAAVMPFMVWCVFRNRIPAALAFLVGVHPLPIILTAAELFRRVRYVRQSEVVCDSDTNHLGSGDQRVLPVV